MYKVYIGSKVVATFKDSEGDKAHELDGRCLFDQGSGFMDQDHHFDGDAIYHQFW